jgi:hypothetical protein
MIVMPAGTAVGASLGTWASRCHLNSGLTGALGCTLGEVFLKRRLCRCSTRKVKLTDDATLLLDRRQEALSVDFLTGS